MEYTLFIFRRDLRIEDNLGLLYTIKKYENIIPVFIFTPEQVGKKNKYRSTNAIQFMIESLESLNMSLNGYGSELVILYGKNTEVIKEIIKHVNVSSIVTNMDYTPYAKKRDNDIKYICDKNNIRFELVEDYLLSPIGTFLKDDNTPYRVYSAFRNRVIEQQDKIPSLNRTRIHAKSFIKTSKLNEIIMNYKKMCEFIDGKYNENTYVKGGRKNGLRYLKGIDKLETYESTRNDLKYETSRLSAYIKFGCISVREVYWKIIKKYGLNHSLLSQLIWREFYYYIGYYFPKVMQGEPFNDRFSYLSERWIKNNIHLNAWKNGMTGYPVVDAGMRELLTTGYMHNRSRLITSNFLNRILGHSWKDGEQYFAEKLVDYDPLVNNGNWQWISSIGVDTKPYSQRIFNPWLQSIRYDKDCEYIKKWIPELKDVDIKHIHKWDKYYNDVSYKNVRYPGPIVDYKVQREKSLKVYKN